MAARVAASGFMECLTNLADSVSILFVCPVALLAFPWIFRKIRRWEEEEGRSPSMLLRGVLVFTMVWGTLRLVTFWRIMTGSLLGSQSTVLTASGDATAFLTSQHFQTALAGFWSAAVNAIWFIFLFRFLRGGVLTETHVRVGGRSVYPSLLIALVLGGVAILVWLRAPRSRAARQFFIWAIVISSFHTDFAYGSEAQIYAYVALEAVTAFLWAPLWLWWALLTPEEAAPKGP